MENKIDMIPKEFIAKERTIADIKERVMNLDLYDEEGLISQLSQLQEIEKDLKLAIKLFDERVRVITNEDDYSNDNYEVTFRSSRLFDKEKATKYIFDNGLQDDFQVIDFDWKKVQHFIKGKEEYEDYTKLGNSRMTIKRK